MRAAAVKYANKADLPTLSEKLEHLFKSKLTPNAGKNKAKSGEEEKQFKIAEKVFEEREKELKQVFSFFSKRGKAGSFGVEDATLEVDDLINMLRKTELLGEGKPLQLADVIASVEKFYAPSLRLEAKLTQELFNAHYKGVLAQQAKATEAQKEAHENEEAEEDEEARRQREE